jgi:predicted MFS family arabinose efflux permease
MYSLLSLVRTQPVARQSAWIGACLFGAISAFWSTMAFFLEKPPFSYSLSVIGLFGFIGLSGAFVSPLAGRLSDKRSPLFPMRWGFLAMALGYIILFKSSWSIAVLIVGIMLIDMGLQAAHIPNLTRVSALQPDARTRLNTIYMTSFFIGGTLGSIVGSYAWTIAGWTGVCTVGLVLVIAGSLPILISLKKKHNEAV